MDISFRAYRAEMSLSAKLPRHLFIEMVSGNEDHHDFSYPGNACMLACRSKMCPNWLYTLHSIGFVISVHRLSCSL